MENENTVYVQLRKESQRGEKVLVAIFPYEIADLRGNVTCLTDIEGHSACARNYINRTKLCSETEEKDLLRTLKDVGYDNLKVIKRSSYPMYLKALQSVRR